MSEWIAALPMYDWPECRDETDAQWRSWLDALRARGIDAPENLTRSGDLQALWRNPHLLLAQTCWGPMEAGLAEHVCVIGQPDYSAYEGGEGAYYSSVILMRKSVARCDVAAPADGRAHLPLDLMRGTRLAYNEVLSRSGFLALIQDLKEFNETIDLFAETLETGRHRASLKAVRDGRADVCAVDCRSWALAQRFEPGVDGLRIVGWTARRLGLPYVTSRKTDAETVASLRAALLS
ncbi:phosphate/phosphite/phosphonate ABC transporter substrate-binding protein [Nitratireductor sp.]|uniref:phosphate/phosphite/phosphonate ABC transporter substrate-binding protein n=1 Tax=Nitratireductor sp. TaxID=1872084 RepID=UPI002600D3B5|nr:PhnD/SsuA/transferrin family substrate-binding protein [Nitratireductor sp.]